METEKTAIIIDMEDTFSLLKREFQFKNITLLKKFSSGREGLDYCLDMRPDLVLLGEIESDLADISVMEICMQIREKYPKIGIVYGVSLEDLSKVLETLKAGASTFFIKPIDPEICMAEIESLLLQRPKILLIDDFIDNLEVLTSYLEDKYEVFSASTARTGLALAIETKPDIVMLDIKLPEIDGMVVLKRLKKFLPTVSVIMMTAFGSEDIAVAAMKQGASDYFTKPFDLNRIGEILSNIVKKRTTDMAEDKLVERIKESEKRYSNLIQNMTEGVVRLDKEGNVSFANKTASTMSNHKELFKKRYTDFIDIEDPLLTAIIRNNAGTPSHHVFEAFIKRYEGKLFPISLSVSKLFEEAQQFSGSMLVFQDITERKTLEKQVKEYTRTLEMKVIERTKELENFVFSVSHDLKSPLRAIEGFSTVIEEDFDGMLDETGHYYLSRIKRNARKMNDLITDLLNYTRIERDAPHLVETDPREALESVLDDLKPLIEQNKKISISYPDFWPPVIAEKSRLYQVFLNLLSNAIKFTMKGQGNAIRLGFEEKEEEQGRIVVFFVQDHGIGFDMKYNDKVFAIFQRLHRTEDYDGTGVGLAIVKKQIEAMGGRIWAEAEEGKGACFFFELPKSSTQQKVQEEPHLA
ncbi:MAG: hybrid sensor histidine kinase/response regulator [Candidatus Hodarchaeales archaeon]|jgi:PAS domain S-box-containing protein